MTDFPLESIPGIKAIHRHSATAGLTFLPYRHAGFKHEISKNDFIVSFFSFYFSLASLLCHKEHMHPLLIWRCFGKSEVLVLEFYGNPREIAMQFPQNCCVWFFFVVVHFYYSPTFSFASVLSPNLWSPSLAARMVKKVPAVRETQVRSLGQEDLLKEMATHFSILAWRFP